MKILITLELCFGFLSKTVFSKTVCPWSYLSTLLALKSLILKLKIKSPNQPGRFSLLWSCQRWPTSPYQTRKRRDNWSFLRNTFSAYPMLEAYKHYLIFLPKKTLFEYYYYSPNEKTEAWRCSIIKASVLALIWAGSLFPWEELEKEKWIFTQKLTQYR